MTHRTNYIFGTDEPCPCGSGAPFGRCCLERKLWPVPSEESTGGADEPPEPTAADRSFWYLCDVLRVAENAKDRFSGIGESATEMVVLDEVGIFPRYRSEGTDRLLELYALLGHRRLGGDRSEIVRGIEIYDLNALADAFSRAREMAELVAFRVADGEPNIEPIAEAADGLEEVEAIYGESCDELRGGRCYVGIRVEVDDAWLVIEPVELGDSAATDLQTSRESGDWGDRTTDSARAAYEADLLTLAMAPDGTESTDDDPLPESRHYRSSAFDLPSISPAGVVVEVMKKLEQHGVAVDGRPHRWARAVAKTDDPQVRRQVLERIESLLSAPAPGVGLIFLDEEGEPDRDESPDVTADEVLEWLGFPDDGPCRLDIAREWRHHVVADLELETDVLRALELQPEDSLQRADEEVAGGSPPAETFREALTGHRRRLRWLGLTRRSTRGAIVYDDRLYGLPLRPRFDDWLGGLAVFFPEMYRRPIRQLPETDGSYRGRLADRAHSELDLDEPVRVCDLPPDPEAILAVRGVGETTVRRYLRAIPKMIADWHAELGPDDPARSIADPESRRKIDDGLDELDDLFD
ncbi:MAG: YecA family protein [Bradymonadaceae bacterium]